MNTHHRPEILADLRSFETPNIKHTGTQSGTTIYESLGSVWNIAYIDLVMSLKK